MNRRDLFSTSAAGLGLLVASSALADGAKKPAGPTAAPARASAADPRAELLAALADCLKAGEACIGHCARELAAGDKDMARCNVTTQAMVALCQALTRLAALDVPAAKKVAAVCAEVCKECELACAEHKAHFAHGMHLECQACMNACIACGKACQAFARA